MPRGRPPEGKHALSDAERQARYRASLNTEAAAPDICYQRPEDRRSRLQRWHDAVALQADYAAWLNALPRRLRGAGTDVVLQAIVDLALAELRATVSGNDQRMQRRAARQKSSVTASNVILITGMVDHNQRNPRLTV